MHTTSPGVCMPTAVGYIKYYSQSTYTADVKKLVCQIDCTGVANVPQPKRRNSLFRLRIQCGGGYLAIDDYSKPVYHITT